MLITKRKIIFDKVRKNILQPCCKLQGGAAPGGTAVSAAPTKLTEQTIGGYGILPYPRSHQTIFPQNPQSPQKPQKPTEVSDARYSPTDCTDAHRLGGYGILPYPRSHQTIFPQKPQNLTQPNHLWASVHICGRLFSTRSFCEFRGRTLRSLTICEHL